MMKTRKRLGIEIHTQLSHYVILVISKSEQDRIWNQYSEHGRKERNMKKCTVTIEATL